MILNKPSEKQIKKTFSVFKKDYVLVPLEIFGKDPYKTLISTIISSRTKDETTLEASKRLFKIAPDIKSLSEQSINKVEKLIYPVSFYKTKSVHLINMSRVVLEKYNGKIPKTRKELMKLPGVGRKTANLAMNRAFNVPAIAVDTHVHRISNTLQWVKTTNPEKTEIDLIEILPKKYWGETNRLFVSIGRQYTTQKRLKEFLENKNLIIS